MFDFLGPFPALLPNLALQGTTIVSSRLKHVAHYAYFVAPNASGTLKTEIPREVRETGLVRPKYPLDFRSAG